MKPSPWGSVRGTCWLAVAEQPARKHAVASAIAAALMRVMVSPSPSALALSATSGVHLRIFRPQAQLTALRLQTRRNGRSFLRFQPELDKPADGFGTGRRVVLPGGPSVDRCNEFVGKAHGASWISARCRTPSTRPLSANFWHCLFHIMVLPYSGLKNKRPAAVLE